MNVRWFWLVWSVGFIQRDATLLGYVPVAGQTGGESE